MKKYNLDIASVRKLHQARQFAQAEAGYLAILRKNPRNIDALHALSILYAQQENYEDAVASLKTAINYEPNNSTLQLHLANILKAQGLFNQAADVLQKTLSSHPTYAAAFNNLGTVFYAQGKLSDAITAYRNAIAQEPTFIDAYYNLGLALGKHDQLDEAIAVYQQLLQLSPEHVAARFHLASTYMRHEKLKEAIAEFILIEKKEPHHFETQSNLAACYLKNSAFMDAKNHYKKALELMPNDSQILFNLGVIDTQLGNIDSAIQFYQKALQIQPDLFAAHNNLGTAFLAKQHIPFALHHFEAAAKLQPENKSLQYTIKALSQNQQLLSAPTDYVKSLFDSYADHYDEHLMNALEYKIPAHFQRALTKLQPASWDILDLGCGTGLCGTIAKPFAKKLMGVDLSEKMLDIARDKNIYDTLECDEFNAFLSKPRTAFDLIIAGDVLVYMGDLTLLFKNIQKALRAKGMFLFNCEINENEDYKMNQSGRFSHQKKYIEILAKKNDLAVIHYEKAVTRMQNNEPVYGHIFVLQRK